MFNRSLLLVGLAVVSAAAIAVAQEGMPQFDGPIDVQSLRSRTLGEVVPRAMLEAPIPVEPFEMAEPPRGTAASWGITLGQIPELLYLHCRPLKDGCGLLVADVLPDSPADRAGLCSGQILLKVDDEVLYKPCDLPEVASGAELEVLDRGEVVKLTIGRCSPKAYAPRAALRTGPGLAESYAASSLRSVASSSAVSDSTDAQHSIAVAVANGRYKIEAIMPAASGYKKVRLEGTRRQVEKQLDDLPQSFRTAIRQQLPEMGASY